jgi:ubiquinone/menaquinone biosynthesis C-methylase UbiE
MPISTSRKFLAAAAAVALIPATIVGRSSVYHVLPFAWTEEPARLADLLDLKPGSRIAEIGAGGGAMAVEMARRAGPGGTLFATELDSSRREAIAALAAAAGASGVQVVEAASAGTALPDACCQALYLRNVFHHIADQAAYARDVARTVAPGGRVVIIDLAPGALWHLGPEHGVRPETVIAALAAAGFSVDRRIDDWGGGMFAIAFRR